jgi:Type ISP C-terminal specificity domain
MFTTDEHVVGIQVGTAVATFVKRGPSTFGKHEKVAKVHYREFWGLGNEKRRLLLASLGTRVRGVPNYVEVRPRATMRWVFVNGESGKPTTYESWPRLVEVFRVVYKGVQPGRGGSLVSIDRKPLLEKMRKYYDSQNSNKELRASFPEIMNDEAGYDANAVRDQLLKKKAAFNESKIIELDWLPFDTRSFWWEPDGKLIHRRRSEFMQQVGETNLFLGCTQKPRKGLLSPALITPRLGSYYVFDPYTTYFPLHIYHEDLHGNGFEPGIRAELLESYCRAIGSPAFGGDNGEWTNAALASAEDIFFHVGAIMWSPAYRQENEGALRQD